MEKIGVQLFGASIWGGNIPLEADIIYCDKECSMRRSGSCLKCRSMKAYCVYGRRETIRGYTKRSSKYQAFYDKYHSDEMYDKISLPSEYYAEMGDMVYLGLEYVGVQKRASDTKITYFDVVVGEYIIRSDLKSTGGLFIPKSDVTVQLLSALMHFKPRNLDGGYIRVYEEYVNSTLLDMSMINSEMYRSLVEYDATLCREPNYVGRYVYVSSLRDGVSFGAKGYRWVKQGDYVVCEDYNLGLLSPWYMEGVSIADVRLLITDTMTVQVDDNAMVDSNTKFSSKVASKCT